MNAFAKERSMELNNNLIQVVIEVTADSHQPLAQEILGNLKLRILEVGGEFELDFHNLLQVLLPVHALEEVANWPEVKFIREPFRPHPIKDSSETGDQSKAGVFEVISSIQSDEGHEIKIPVEYFKEKSSENGSIYQGDLIAIQSLKSFCDDTVCQKKVEKFPSDSSGYEEISNEEAKDYENSLEEDSYLKGENIVRAQADSEVYFCLEYNCSSVTVSLGGVTHPETLNCNNIISFSKPAGTYSIYASGCGVSWSGTITVSEGNYGIPICPPTGNSDCCPIGCGEGGSYVCGQCSESETPNLTPYKPSGWSDKIVVSNNLGDYLDDSPPVSYTHLTLPTN